jgi:DNA-binding Lrp family transcriptional regulator
MDFRPTVMKKFDKACLKVRIHKLALLKGTGTPAEMADRFEISERSVKRIIKEMRDEGIHLRYDYIRISYVLSEN